MTEVKARRSLGLALPLPVALALFSIAGCKTTPAVGSRMILPPGAQVMEIPKDHTFLMASPLSQPMPAFPLGSPRDTEVEVCVEIVIDGSGKVSSATPLFAVPECPLDEATMDQRFVAAVTTTVTQWQFLAAAVCTFPPGVAVNDECTGNGVVISAIPIKLSYVFSFHKGGRITVGERRM